MGACNSAKAEIPPTDAKQTSSPSGTSPNVAHPREIKIESAHVQDIVSSLRKVPMLAKLNDEECKVLARELQERVFQDGETVFAEGDDGLEFFIIKSGSVLISKTHPESGQPQHLRELKAGDYFGEAALMTTGKRMATIQAKGTVVCLVLGKAQFEKLFGSGKLKVVVVKRAAISAESHITAVTAPPSAIREKSAHTFEMILRAFQQCVLFKDKSLDYQKKIIESMWLVEVSAGKPIITQGSKADNFYVVDSGNFDIFVSADGGKTSIKVAARGPGEYFGELALVEPKPRQATVTPSVDSKVWAVDRWTYHKILRNLSQEKQREYERVLESVSSLPLLDYERSKVAEALEEESFRDGTVIFQQGAEADKFYIVKRGTVVITKVQDGRKTELSRCETGNFFGERALITKETRFGTATCSGDVDVLALSRDAFTLLLGPMDEVFRQRLEDYKKGTVVTAAPEQKAPSDSQADDYLDRTIRFEDLLVLGTLGKGSFGHVQLVQNRGNKQLYALKVVSKQQIVHLGQQEHIMSEKRVMASLNSPFLIRLYATFRKPNSLEFLLEPCLGGELFSLLRQRTFFDEQTARFYAAAVVLGFEYMHNKGIIYRDLKPENLLIDEKGYLKITDFGFAKRVGDKKTYTLCGTPDYLAPEVVSGQGHGKGVDWWTLGVLIFEMLASYPPFYDEDPMKTYAKIMQGDIQFPMHFSKNAVDLIKKLLHQKPTKRLGAGGAKSIKQHPFFQGFNWQQFENRQMPAPIIIDINKNDLLANFEKYPEDHIIEPYTGQGDWDSDF